MVYEQNAVLKNADGRKKVLPKKLSYYKFYPLNCWELSKVINAIIQNPFFEKKKKLQNKTKFKGITIIY
jgi:hypothetical protein